MSSLPQDPQRNNPSHASIQSPAVGPTATTTVQGHGQAHGQPRPQSQTHTQQVQGQTQSLPSGGYQPPLASGERTIGKPSSVDTRTISAATSAASPSYRFGPPPAGLVRNTNGPTAAGAPGIHHGSGPRHGQASNITQVLPKPVMYGATAPLGPVVYPPTAVSHQQQKRASSSTAMMSRAIGRPASMDVSMDVSVDVYGQGQQSGVLPRPAVHVSPGRSAATTAMSGPVQLAAAASHIPGGACNASPVVPRSNIMVAPHPQGSTASSSTPPASSPKCEAVEAGVPLVRSSTVPSNSALASGAIAKEGVVAPPREKGNHTDESDETREKMKPPPERKRSLYTLLPPGFLETYGGKAGSSVAKEKPAPVDEIPAGGHLNAVIDSVSSDLKRSSDLRSGSHARSGTRRWLLSDHQVTDDIKTMRVDLPAGVVVEPTERKNNETIARAGADPRLTPSEQKWLKAAEEDEGREETAVLAQQEEEPAADDGGGEVETTDGDVGKGKGKGKAPDRGASGATKVATTVATVTTAAETASASEGSTAGGSASMAPETAPGAGGSAAEAAEGVVILASGKDKLVESTVETINIVTARPSGRELTDWDAKRDALELKEVMILERTRERRKCLSKERTRGQAVIQYLTQLQRKERGRTNLLRAKGLILADVARMLPKRVAETNNLRREIGEGNISPSTCVAESTKTEIAGVATFSNAKEFRLMCDSVERGEGETKANANNAIDAMEVDGEEVDSPSGPSGGAPVSGAQSREDKAKGSGGPPAAGDGGQADYHSVTSLAMLKCWNAVGERLMTARVVVREADVEQGSDAAARPSSLLGSGGARVEGGRLRGSKARLSGKTGVGGRSKKVEATDVEDDGAGGESLVSSSDESNEGRNDGHALVRGHGGRFRKRKLGRSLVNTHSASLSTTRKRGKSGDPTGTGGVVAGADVAHGEPLDWPSTVVPRTPYGIPLLLSCLSSYPDKVAAALHPGPQGTSDQQPLYTASAAALAGGDRASELTSSLLPGLKRAELLKEANLQDRARCEQSESVCRMYAEASKSVAEPKASAPRLKNAFRPERWLAEREMWRQEVEELEEAVANATPPPVDGAAVKGKGKAKGRPGAAVVARVLGKDPSPAPSSSSSLDSSTSQALSASPRSFPRAVKPVSVTIPGAAKLSLPTRPNTVSSAAALAGKGKEGTPTYEPSGARKGRSAKGGARPPSPAIGRRSSTRGSEAKGRT